MALRTSDYYTGASYGTSDYVSVMQESIGAYIQHRAKFGDHFAVNAGIRADVDTVVPKPAMFNGISPRVALIGSVDPTFNIKLVGSSVFRALRDPLVCFLQGN